MRKIYLTILVLFISVLLLSSLYSADKEFEKKYNLKSQVDEKNGIVWYKHKKSTGGNAKIYPYIGQRVESGQCFLRMVIIYVGRDNLFIKEYIFTADDVEFALTPRKKIETVETRDNFMRSEGRDTSGGICEIYDVAANQEEFELMEKISQAKKVKLRYNGVKGYKKAAIHKSTKKAIKEVLDAYKELTGISNQ